MAEQIRQSLSEIVGRGLGLLYGDIGSRLENYLDADAVEIQGLENLALVAYEIKQGNGAMLCFNHIFNENSYIRLALDMHNLLDGSHPVVNPMADKYFHGVRKHVGQEVQRVTEDLAINPETGESMVSILSVYRSWDKEYSTDEGKEQNEASYAAMLETINSENGGIVILAPEARRSKTGAMRRADPAAAFTSRLLTANLDNSDLPAVVDFAKKN